MNAISFKKWVSTILLLAITISLCGCSTNRTAASQDEHLTTTTAFIVLNGANVPALNSSAIASFVDTPQDGDRSILIVPDGNPSITTFSFDSTAKNVTYATAESKKWYKEICTSIIDARPDDADTDLLSAILLAANELKASDTQARHLMLLCNGLNTAPMLNFAETPFWSDATSIDEIISQLLKLNYLSADQFVRDIRIDTRLSIRLAVTITCYFKFMECIIAYSILEDNDENIRITDFVINCFLISLQPFFSHLLTAKNFKFYIEFIKNRIPNGQNFILKFVPLFLCIIYGRCQKDANNLMRVHFSHYMNPPSMGNYESFRLSEFVSSKAHVSISTASSIILSLHTIISKAQAPLLSVACSKSYSICTR